MSSIIETLIEIKLKEKSDFLKVKETLTRIGVSSKKEKTLYQSCHILHKQGLYYIVHFKEMFLLDGKPTNLSDEDIARRNRIISLLDDWGLVKVVDKKKMGSLLADMNKIKVINYKEKNEWKLEPKYTIGNRETI